MSEKVNFDSARETVGNDGAREELGEAGGKVLGVYNDILEEEKRSRNTFLGLLSIVFEEKKEEFEANVFTNVDRAAVVERLNPYVERLNAENLSELMGTLQEDREDGLQKLGEYLREIMELDDHLAVKIEYADDLGADTAGLCVPHFWLNSAVIKVREDATTPEIVSTTMHEMWHARQQGEMSRAFRNFKDAEGGFDLLAMQYFYNKKNYATYEKGRDKNVEQLLEIEAYGFEELAYSKLQQAANIMLVRQRDAFAKAHPEIYSEANREGINNEVTMVIRGMDVGRLLQEMGVDSVEDLCDQEKILERTPRIMQALLNFVGVKKSIVIEMVDNERDDGITTRSSYVGGTIKVNTGQVRKQSVMEVMSIFSKSAWLMRQYEQIAAGSSRGELYKSNMDHWFRRDEEGFREQLVIAERERFAGDLLRIIDEADSIDYALQAEITANEAAESLSKIEDVLEISIKYGVRGIEEKIQQLRQHFQRAIDK